MTYSFKYSDVSYIAQINLITNDTTIKIAELDRSNGDIGFKEFIFRKEGEDFEDAFYGRIAEYLGISLTDSKKIKINGH